MQFLRILGHFREFSILVLLLICCRKHNYCTMLQYQRFVSSLSCSFPLSSNKAFAALPGLIQGYKAARGKEKKRVGPHPQSYLLLLALQSINK